MGHGFKNERRGRMGRKQSVGAKRMHGNENIGRRGEMERGRWFWARSAFLPRIGVPPGEVIWMQIRLKRSISIEERKKQRKPKETGKN